MRQTTKGDTLHSLGVIAYQLGQYAQAAEQIAEAISSDSRQAAFHSNLGLTLRALGRCEEARAAYERALELRPEYPDALSNLGSPDIRSRRDERLSAVQPEATEFTSAEFHLPPRNAITRHPILSAAASGGGGGGKDILVSGLLGWKVKHPWGKPRSLKRRC